MALPRRRDAPLPRMVRRPMPDIQAGDRRRMPCAHRRRMGPLVIRGLGAGVHRRGRRASVDHRHRRMAAGAGDGRQITGGARAARSPPGLRWASSAQLRSMRSHRRRRHRICAGTIRIRARRRDSGIPARSGWAWRRCLSDTGHRAATRLPALYPEQIPESLWRGYPVSVSQHGEVRITTHQQFGAAGDGEMQENHIVALPACLREPAGGSRNCHRFVSGNYFVQVCQKRIGSL